jgi:uncharacterized membrane protein YtjA (UPF0391 family)
MASRGPLAAERHAALLERRVDLRELPADQRVEPGGAIEELGIPVQHDELPQLLVAARDGRERVPVRLQVLVAPGQEVPALGGLRVADRGQDPVDERLGLERGGHAPLRRLQPHVAELREHEDREGNEGADDERRANLQRENALHAVAWGTQGGRQGGGTIRDGRVRLKATSAFVLQENRRCADGPSRMPCPRIHPESSRGSAMRKWVLAFVIGSIIAAALGLAGVAGGAAAIAELLFLVCVVPLVAFLVLDLTINGGGS